MTLYGDVLRRIVLQLGITSSAGIVFYVPILGVEGLAVKLIRPY
jgi:hypothetical protein